MAKKKKNKSHPIAIDLFCGAGGLTRGLLDAGINVIAGYDIDGTCKYPYATNNHPAKFFEVDVGNLTSAELDRHFKGAKQRILVGCAPCQPFSKYTQGKNNESDPKWGLLKHFSRLALELSPEVISMENVVELRKHTIFSEFEADLVAAGYKFTSYDVYAPDYGLPQQRTRLLAFASKKAEILLPPKTHKPESYLTAESIIKNLPRLEHGTASTDDPLHRCSRLSPLNLQRIRASKPGGTWKDWPKRLVADCHKAETGLSYPSVYGRFEWHKPVPTITTQFFGFGSGRFGHPEQDRALSLREGALLQGFPENYRFIEPGVNVSIKAMGRLIGNAVPVTLGKVVGDAIKNHIEQHY